MSCLSPPGQPERTLGLQLLSRFFKAEPAYGPKMFLSVKGAIRPNWKVDSSDEFLLESVTNIKCVFELVRDVVDPDRPSSAHFLPSMAERRRFDEDHVLGESDADRLRPQMDLFQPARRDTTRPIEDVRRTPHCVDAELSTKFNIFTDHEGPSKAR